MNRKILFIDVDGTLVDYENHLPESAIIAIRKARLNGHKIYICTGRSKAEVYQKLWDIGLDGMIGGNGNYIEDNGKVIMHQLLSLEQCHNIVDWLHKENLEFYLESNNGLFASENFELEAEPVIREYSKRKGKENTNQITVRDAFPEMIFGGQLYRNDVNKVSYILKSYRNYLDAAKAFPDLKAGTWGGVGETALFGDLGVKNITKARAIHTLIRYLNVPIEDTIAFGDAKIDISMFEFCNESCCMGNGGTEAKSVAKYITDNVEDDGLYKAFLHYQLIDE